MTIFDHQEKIAADYRNRGYNVEYEVVGNSGAIYDMIARNNDKSIVFQFKPQSTLTLNTRVLSRLRQSARQDGYQDFHLVVLPEEQATPIRIAKLDETLLTWLNQNSQVTSNTMLDSYFVAFTNVEQVEIHSLTSQSGSSGADVTGTAVAEFSVSPVGGDRPVEWDCPLRFALHLDSNWHVESVQLMSLELSNIAEDLKEFLSGESP